MKMKVIKRKKYVNIPIPVALADKIDEAMANSKMAYRTKTEFILDCVRERLRGQERNKRAEDNQQASVPEGESD